MHQALRDTHFRVEEPGAEHDEADTSSYLAAARSVMMQMVGDDKAEKVVKQRVYHRSAAHDSCVGIDHQLQILSGRGMVQLQPQQDDTIPIENCPHLFLL